ncbi:MAG: transcriptional repressor [Rhodocyclaceae bacterium]|nr:transcriptional repressor [Rhodocyclaceae bacterium]
MSQPSRDPAGQIAARGGRVTRTRTAVLSVLSDAGRPISHDEVAAALDARGVIHDRVTLYRTLDWLVSHELAHKVAGPDRAWRFNAVGDEGHQHAHFHCELCGRVFCLESLQPAIAATLPSGFRLGRAELSFHGLCPSCPESQRSRAPTNRNKLAT